MSLSPALTNRRLVPPEIIEPIRRKLCVSNGVLDVAVAKIGLNSARIEPFIGEIEPAGMPQHVRMHLKCKLSVFPNATDDPLEGGYRHGPTPFGSEQVRTFRVVATE